MENERFVMSPQKAGRMRYLILTMLVPLGIMYGTLGLMENGLIPKIKILAFASYYGSLVLMAVMGYFLIFKKNHTLTISPNGVLETTWRKQQINHALRDIRCYRRNLLGEYILMDDSGMKIFCVEPNMTNRDRFLDWLAAHHIESK